MTLRIAYNLFTQKPRQEKADFARWIKDPELTVVELAPRPETGAATALGNLSLAGVAGALAGAN